MTLIECDVKNMKIKYGFPEIGHLLTVPGVIVLPLISAAPN